MAHKGYVDAIREPHPVDIEVGRRLRSLRRRCGISQDDLARSLGLTFQQVQKYERGTSRLSVSLVVRIACLLYVAPAQLLPDLRLHERVNAFKP